MIWNTLQRFNNLSKCFLLTLGIVFLAILLHVTSVSYMRKATLDKMEYLKSADSLMLNSADLLLPKPDPAFRTLKNQFSASQKLKDYYEDLGSTYYRNYYVFSTCSIVFVTLLAVAVFLVINAGWNNSPQLIKTFFLVSICISSFYFFLPSVFENRENFALNFKKARSFEQIQMNILAYASQPYAGNVDSLRKELAGNYHQIAENFDLLTIEINPDKLGGNPEEILKSLNSNYVK